ncbi:hypothetical protein Tco_1219211 [Tanacetum coccineum]
MKRSQKDVNIQAWENHEKRKAELEPKRIEFLDMKMMIKWVSSSVLGCEVHRRGSTYFAAFLATELESTSDASPEPEEPADDTHHSNINRTKAEDREASVKEGLCTDLSAPPRHVKFIRPAKHQLKWWLKCVCLDAEAGADIGSFTEDFKMTLLPTKLKFADDNNVETVEEGDAIVAEEGGILALAEVIKDDVAVIDKTQSRVVDLIVSTLRLSNLDIVASYVFRGGNNAPMPAAKSDGNDVPWSSNIGFTSKQTWWYRVESDLLRRADAEVYR